MIKSTRATASSEAILSDNKLPAVEDYLSRHQNHITKLTVECRISKIENNILPVSSHTKRHGAHSGSKSHHKVIYPHSGMRNRRNKKIL